MSVFCCPNCQSQTLRVMRIPEHFQCETCFTVWMIRAVNVEQAWPVLCRPDLLQVCRDAGLSDAEIFGAPITPEVPS